VLNSPQNLERGVFTQATFEGMAREAMMVAPFRFPAQPLKANSPAPAAGAHNAVVFSQEAP
jgi:crotonobetainyl-CoA:carnitine CoA-transferase CaiB-like acyl-CoA transferase